jgi:hypothetical protein
MGEPDAAAVMAYQALFNALIDGAENNWPTLNRPPSRNGALLVRDAAYYSPKSSPCRSSAASAAGRSGIAACGGAVRAGDAENWARLFDETRLGAAAGVLANDAIARRSAPVLKGCQRETETPVLASLYARGAGPDGMTTNS